MLSFQTEFLSEQNEKSTSKGMASVKTDGAGPFLLYSVTKSPCNLREIGLVLL